jgi:tetratricopeptide (TPR) repeat protein
MILGDGLTPISKLSGAFLTPPSPLHLQFAYFESSLVVEFLIQRFGRDRLKAILRDLGEGSEINQTIEKHTQPMARLESDFAAFARERAHAMAPGLDWEKPGFARADPAGGRGRRRGGSGRSGTNSVVLLPGFTPDEHETWETWAEKHPTNYWVMSRKAAQLVESNQWTEAKPLLQQLVALYPDDTGADSAYRLLAATHRGLGQTNDERQVLARFAEKDAEAIDAYLRLMELGAIAKDWPSVVLNAQRYLAVNPLVAPPYRFLALAAERTGANPAAIAAYRALLELEPPDPAEVHFNLAAALHRERNPEARRQVLMALEEAPRYRSALQLLLQLNEEAPKPGTNGPPPRPGTEPTPVPPAR